MDKWAGKGRGEMGLRRGRAGSTRGGHGTRNWGKVMAEGLILRSHFYAKHTLLLDDLYFYQTM
jgi:hypothetical protein